MPLYVPSLDGQAVFGTAVSMDPSPCDLAMSYAAFFGVNGVFSLAGGSRGHRIDVEGVLYGVTLPLLVQARSNLLSFMDGLPHVLFDTVGVSWPAVVFAGGWRQEKQLLYLAGGYVGWKYSLELVSNT